jgi:hypothetical protein
LNGQNDPVTVYGVTFTTGTQSGTNYTLTGAGGSFTNYNNSVGNGGIGTMLQDFYYGGMENFTQAGLTPGVTYSIRFYTTPFGTPGGDRVQTLTEGSTLPIATNASTPSYSEDAGVRQILNYTFTPINAAQRTINFTPQTIGNSEHQYAFSTQIASTSLQGAVTGLHNTGVNDDETVSTSASDIHYTLVAAPAGVALGPANVDTAGNGFQGGWLNNDALSQWISPPGANTSAAVPPGDYTYQTTFTTNGSTAGMTLTGLWATDDTGADIIVNGVSQNEPNPDGFSEFTPFTIGNLVSGVNTIDFVVDNGGNSPNPTGLRVEWLDVADVTPEPASISLAALATLSLLRRNRGMTHSR